MDPNIVILIDRTLEGDLQAYAGIVREYQAQIWQIVAYGIQSAEATEDLVQQAFINAYQALPSYDITQDFGTWIRTIARNLLRNELRRRGREDKRLRRYHQWLSVRLDGNVSADDQDTELREQLRLCRKQLAAPAKLALRLRYEQALGFDEIANTLDRSIAATRQLLQRVRIALRRCLTERVRA